MKKFAILLSGLALSALPCTSALADNLNFNFTGATFSGSGALTFAGSTGPAVITAATGSVMYGGSTYSLALLPVGGFAGNDNLFTGSTIAPFDFNGVGLSLVGSSNIALNLYTVPPITTNFELLGVNGGPQIGTETASYNASISATPPTTVTPEPGSLALLGTGALGVVGVLRRKLAV